MKPLENGELQHWDKEERRKGGSGRREFSERRAANERRFDYRDAEQPPRRSIKSWVRALSNARLGVDRRKGSERRLQDRRSLELRSLLSSEEIEAFLRE